MITAASLIPQKAIIELSNGKELTFKPLSVMNKIELLNRLYPTPSHEEIDGVRKPILPARHAVIQTAKLNTDLSEGNLAVMVKMLYLLCEQRDEFQDLDHFSQVFTLVGAVDETNAILYAANIVRGTHALLENALEKAAVEDGDADLKKILDLMRSKIRPISTR